jgi:hypothetical protein
VCRLDLQAVIEAREIYKAKAKCKHDYLGTQKRDMRFTKAAAVVEHIDYDVVSELSTSKYSEIAGGSLPPFLVGYKKGAFHEDMKLIHRTFASFESLVCIDLSGQLIGFSGMQKLCELAGGN